MNTSPEGNPRDEYDETRLRHGTSKAMTSTTALANLQAATQTLNELARHARVLPRNTAVKRALSSLRQSLDLLEEHMRTV